MTDLSRTLEELERRKDDPSVDSSALVMKCRQLRKKPLQEFTIEDLRIMIGQNLGLKFLVPVALARLEHDPLAEGDYYPGDLLKSVLTVERGFWNDRTELREQVARLAEKGMSLVDQRGEGDVVRKALVEGLKIFRG